MTRTCTARFVQDFIFTDNNNHKEFLKRIQRLDKDDGILLVNLLERVATGDGTTPLARVQRLGNFDPQRHIDDDDGVVTQQDATPYVSMATVDSGAMPSTNMAKGVGSSVCLRGNTIFPKHPLRIAESYVGAKNMSKHTLNIYEVAYLNPIRRHVVAAITCFIVQWALMAILAFYDIFDQEARVNYSKEDTHFLLTFVAFGSSVVFLHKFMLQGGKCIQFAQTYLKMTPPQHRRDIRRNFQLILDFSVNVVLGVFIFLFNIYFILISDDANSAILNALALFFILEIDDELTPDMDDDEVEDFKAVKLLRHVLRPLKEGDSLTVKKVVAGNVTPKTGPGCYADDDILYINVCQDEVEGTEGHPVLANVVSVWKADGEGMQGLTTQFTEIKYIIGGNRANQFCESLSDFRCIQNWRDMSN